ncbi:hypothetical protein [Microlunatus phosphovorus]|nr:hypothetical protein [Microlunatus phosphovorus]
MRFVLLHALPFDERMGELVGSVPECRKVIVGRARPGALVG